MTKKRKALLTAELLTATTGAAMLGIASPAEAASARKWCDWPLSVSP